ncbi:lysophospholipid acyltransferase family protein [Chitinilyticum aquatile]|uniref:lysophospholipid acyltransferase family protein n=1 Tax=Chitinilyticum aquatile TaxID=362520 RepID=UPI0003F9DA88|nr:lysophospholipid acyltransferase family protein [Chitinilyticum aquatile]
MIWLRSGLYWLGMIVTLPFYALLATFLLLLPPLPRYRIMASWAKIMIVWLRITCGLKHRVEGLEHLQIAPAVMLCKHQSAWETLSLQLIMPPLVWVLKQELLKLPFFGWGLRCLSPIAIDRSKRSEAGKKLMEQGRDRLAKGFWIVIFPEGTRVPPGERGRYQQGGARLALDLGVPVVPVAHNAGEFWPRNSFLKYPGEITMIIGAPIATAGRSSAEVNREAEAWIEGQMDRISGVGPCHPANASVHGGS